MIAEVICQIGDLKRLLEMLLDIEQHFFQNKFCFFRIGFCNEAKLLDKRTENRVNVTDRRKRNIGSCIRYERFGQLDQFFCAITMKQKGSCQHLIDRLRHIFGNNFRGNDKNAEFRLTDCNEAVRFIGGCNHHISA